MTEIQTALLSVSDKTGIDSFASALHRLGVRLISTGGTYRTLVEAGIPVIPVDEVTGFPEILDGRVKTLHPKIHGGLLALRTKPEHIETLAAHEIERIDLVAVNLYPFEVTVSSGAPFEECIEQIDIGGPSMLRSAAKNFQSVTVICDPNDYERILSEIQERGNTSPETRKHLAEKVFQTTARYDSAIYNFLTSKEESSLPDTLTILASKTEALRYGENPHQQAALYGGFHDVFEYVHGKALSFNNIVDIQAAAELIDEFTDPATAIIKHTNPCGCATAGNLNDAYIAALSTDPLSAFGGIVAVNREVNAALALELNKIFLEVIVAPEFDNEALDILRQKKDRRLIRVRQKIAGRRTVDIKSIANGYLCQTVDTVVEDASSWKVVTKRAPTEKEQRALSFAWKVAKHVKSNAIVYTDDHKTLGIGAGQMSRVDSSAIAVLKAQKAGHDLTGSVVASDAFFPFADGLLEAVKAGATAVIQPGGSVRDAEVVAAADEHGIAMITTGIRHFKH